MSVVPEVFNEKTRDDKLTPSAPVLTKEEGDNAVKTLKRDELIKMKFPRVSRLRVDPPVNAQNVYCLHTFIPSKNAKPDKDGVFGIMKCRGTFPNLQEADTQIETLIRNVDSNHEIMESYVGREFPVTIDDRYFKIDEINLKDKMTAIAKEDMLSKKQDDQKAMKEIEDRKAELSESTKDVKEKSLDDLEYYTSLRTKRATLRQYQEELEKKVKEVGGLLKECNKEIHKLDDKNPTFDKEFKPKYMEAIKKVGGDEKTNEILKYM